MGVEYDGSDRGPSRPYARNVERGGTQRIPRPPGARAGGPAPWADVDAGGGRLTLIDVRDVLATLPPARPPEMVAPGSRDASVLVPLYEIDGEVRVILTKRPESMPSHRGEIAFPGGKVMPGESLVDAALREAHEEVGLLGDTVDVVAELDTISTVASKFVITPFVGLLAARPELVPHPGEVDAVLEVGLSELLEPEAFHAEHWDIFGTTRAVYFFELPGETVWGATARILTGLLTALTGVPAPSPPAI